MNKLIDLNQNLIKVQNEDEVIGLFVLKGKDSIKTDLKFIHEEPHIYSRITLKFILLDESELDLQATVVIKTGASQTNTYLKIDTLLLSEKARAHVVPSMEIMEDNVKGGHGATIGMLDENQLWYLMSRGISQRDAENLLIEAFVNSLTEKIEDPEIKENLKDQISKLKN